MPDDPETLGIDAEKIAASIYAIYSTPLRIARKLERRPTFL